MTDGDREQKLQQLAAENARWAEAERQLIKAIQEHKRRLERLPEIIRLLPGIIRGLKEEQRHVTAEMIRTGAEHDALEAEGEGAGFRAWANDMADDYADFQATTMPPRPNPFGLFKEPE